MRTEQFSSLRLRNIGLAVATLMIAVPCMAGPCTISIDDALARQHVALTLDSLFDALRSPAAAMYLCVNDLPFGGGRVPVRVLAAAKLAQMKSTDAISPMREAVDRESDPRVRLSLALALAQLGDNRGIAVLGEACRESGAAERLILTATRYLLDLGHQKEGCRQAVVRAIGSQSEPDSLQEATLLFLRFKNVPPDETESVSQALLRSLRSPVSSMRSVAGFGLLRLGNPDAAPYLEAAAQTESDAQVAETIRRYAEQLRKRQE